MIGDWGAGCPSEGFVGSHCRPPATCVSRAPPLAPWSLRSYAHRGMFASTSWLSAAFQNSAGVDGGTRRSTRHPADANGEVTIMRDATTASAESAVRPFRVEVPQVEIDELRRRINATRWPTRELVTDRSQGVQLAAMQNLARYWTTEYDWRRCEARLNALPQFKTEIDGVDIHFIHVESAHKNALPLIMTHGWPGSVVELLETIGPLTDPTAHGGRAEDAFHLVLPSIPGYGFSDE